MRLENERFCVEIAELGAELTRIYDRKTETDILWEGDPVYWKRHSPVLFPNVGKTYPVCTPHESDEFDAAFSLAELLDDL